MDAKSSTALLNKGGADELQTFNKAGAGEPATE
jgi:hypothetical protein